MNTRQMIATVLQRMADADLRTPCAMVHRETDWFISIGDEWDDVSGPAERIASCLIALNRHAIDSVASVFNEAGIHELFVLERCVADGFYPLHYVEAHIPALCADRHALGAWYAEDYVPNINWTWRELNKYRVSRYKDGKLQDRKTLFIPSSVA